MDIRERIRQRIEALGLSVRGASLAAGLGETTLRNYLDGMTESMTTRSVEKLAPVLETTSEWILGGEAPRQSAQVIDIWDRVPLDRREQVLQILQTFAEDGRRA